MTLAEMLDYVEDKAAFERLLSALDVPAFALKNPVVMGKLKLAARGLDKRPPLLVGQH